MENNTPNLNDSLKEKSKNFIYEIIDEDLKTNKWNGNCLLYTSDAADERSSVDLGGRRIIKKKKKRKNSGIAIEKNKQTNKNKNIQNKKKNSKRKRRTYQ